MIKKVVCVLAPMLGIRGDIKSVFSTNAIFATSKTVDTLKNCTDLWEKCWPIHQYLLAIVRPEAILCLGYQDGKSAFSFLKAKSNATASDGAARPGPGNRSYALIRYFRARLPIEKLEPLACTVIGIPHHARYSTFVSTNLGAMKDELAKILGGN